MLSDDNKEFGKFILACIGIVAFGLMVSQCSDYDDSEKLDRCPDQYNCH